MDRHGDGYNLAFLSLLARLLILLHHVDSLNNNLVDFRKRLDDLAGLALVLAREHYYFVVFFDSHIFKIKRFLALVKR